MTKRFRKPAFWLAVPAFLASLLALGVDASFGPVAGMGVAAAGALAIGFFAESRLARLVGSLVRIARGDRFAILPDAVGDGTVQRFGEAAEAMRATLGHADNLAIDRDRQVTESRLRQAGRQFITRRFQAAIDDVMTTFTQTSERIRVTAADLTARNRDMSDRVANAAQSAEAAASDAARVADTARQVREIVLRSGDHVEAARQATERTSAELRHADETVRGLHDAAQEIDVILKLIQSIAGQTSLLALNATIEAARAGEAGRGFAVVASEVKELANQTKHATNEIRSRIVAIQTAVRGTASAIGAVSTSVAATGRVNRDLNAILEQQLVELDHIGDEANRVAMTVARALPDIQSAIAEVAQASESVLGTADDLAARSQSLVGSIGGYFTELDHGAIRIGILHSLSGTLTASERPLQQLLVMLIEQVNQAGGLLHRPLEAVIADPGSDPAQYARLAEAMLETDQVAAIFGCWSSASRKQVLPVLERCNGLLFYPSQYEGEEQSPQVIYTGATPRQQALPAVEYLLERGRRRFILVGSDYVYPRTTNAILRNFLASRGIGPDAIMEIYVNYGERIWRESLESMARFGTRGDAAIVSTISGDSNVHFFREYARQQLSPAHLPVMTLSIGESELTSLRGVPMQGHLASWSYLGGIDDPHNRDFVRRWRAFTGDEKALPNDPMEATFIGFRMWAAAVEKAGTTDAGMVRAALAGMACAAPSGFTVQLDAQSQHLQKPAFIGRITDEGTILPVWTSPGLVPPEPWSPWLKDEGLRKAS
ncbi:MAG: transporter substrate-binding protein [Pseudorhodoplanes sp.]